MLRYCYCGRCQLDTEDADMVVNGRPLCASDCVQRARTMREDERERFRIGGQNIGSRRTAFNVVGG
jgi:hypothetical protein